MTRHTSTRSRAAFTLIEVLVVIAIMGVLATIVLGITREVFRYAYIKDTHSMLLVALNRVEACNTTFGQYPTGSMSDVVKQIRQLGGGSTAGMFQKKFYDADNDTLIDSWGHEIGYYYSTSGSVDAKYNAQFLKNNRGPLLVSAGPNGDFDGGGDDLIVPRPIR